MRNRIFPYPTLQSPLSLALTDLQIDNRPARPGLLDGDNRLLNLYQLDLPNWQKVSVELEVIASKNDLLGVENSMTDPMVTVVALCGPTNQRQAVRLRRAGVERSHWIGRLELDRQNFGGRVTLRALLCGTIEKVEHRMAGSSEDWSIHFDEPLSLLLSGTLKVTWCDFHSAEAPALAREFQDVAHVVDLNGSPVPVVYLNSSFDDLEPLLRDRKDRTPTERALHDLQRMSIARSVWMALLHRAVAAIQPGEEGEEPDFPATEWHREVLEQYLPSLLPGRSDGDMLRAVADLSTQSGWGTFLSRAEAVVGDRIGANKKLRETLRNLARSEVNE